MKKYKIPAYLIFFLFLLPVLMCRKEEPEVKNTYTFYDVRWNPTFSSVDDPDFDNDEYVTAAVMNCFVNLEQDVSATVFAKIYSRTKGSTSAFQNYSTSDTVSFNGVDSPLMLSLTVGSQVTEFTHGEYEFAVELYEFDTESGNARLVSDSRNYESIKVENKFERLNEDRDIQIKASWQKGVDINKDGYAAEAELKIDVNFMGLVNVAGELRAEVEYKKTSESDDKYIEYTSISSFEVIGNTEADTLVVKIGKKSKAIEHGEYDFRILVYKASGFLPVASLTFEDNAVMRKKFQGERDDDYFYHINLANLVWTGGIDSDNDTYFRQRFLQLDVDMEKDTAVKNIIAMLYIMPNDTLLAHGDTAGYVLYDSLKYQVTGIGTSDMHTFDVSKNYRIILGADTSYYSIDSTQYHFMIEIYEDVPKNKRVMKDAAGSDTVAVLRALKFENASTDGGK